MYGDATYAGQSVRLGSRRGLGSRRHRLAARLRRASSTGVSRSTTRTSPTTSGPTRSRSPATGSTTTATAMSMTSTAGTSTTTTPPSTTDRATTMAPTWRAPSAPGEATASAWPASNWKVDPHPGQVPGAQRRDHQRRRRGPRLRHRPQEPPRPEHRRDQQQLGIPAHRCHGRTTHALLDAIDVVATGHPLHRGRGQRRQDEDIRIDTLVPPPATAAPLARRLGTRLGLHHLGREHRLDGGVSPSRPTTDRPPSTWVHQAAASGARIRPARTPTCRVPAWRRRMWQVRSPCAPVSTRA